MFFHTEALFILFFFSFSSYPRNTSHVQTLEIIITIMSAVEEPKKEEVPAAAPAADAAAAPQEGDDEPKKPSKKELKKLEKAAAKAAAKAAVAAAQPEVKIQFDPEVFGPMPLIESRVHTQAKWDDVADVVGDRDGQEVRIRARIAVSRKASAKLAFIVIRDRLSTIQCVLSEGKGLTRDHIKWVTSLPVESIIDLVGVVVKPAEPVNSCSQKDAEVQVTKTFLVSASQPVLPFQMADASGQTELEVTQDTRLEHRWLDMRTPTNYAIWNLKSKVCMYFREYLSNLDFCEIQTPKIIPAASEGGANVFKLGYFGSNAFLAQSPQLYKQMALMGDLKRVFEVGPVFRAEDSNTHRHLCEFVGLDVELEIKEHYYEVLDVAEGLFTHIFDSLQNKCSKLIETTNAQWPATPFVHKMTNETVEALKIGIIDGEEKRESEDEYGALIKDRSLSALRMTYPNAVRLLNTALAGTEENPKMGETEDLSTPNEKLLGKLVKERYGVDFFIVDWFPASVRPFYTMPCPHDTRFSNSYDMFMRGEEISSGAQRIHVPELLEQRGAELEVDMSALKHYVNAFRLGASPHGGFGVGLERVVMLYLGLHNIRSCSMFPRTPIRNTP